MWGVFCAVLVSELLPTIFSPFWREKFLVGPEKKHLGPTIYFPSSPPNQTYSKKVFFPIFSPKFSIHPISPPNKHTLKLLVDPVIYGWGGKPCQAPNTVMRTIGWNCWGICNDSTIRAIKAQIKGPKLLRLYSYAELKPPKHAWIR